MPETCRRRWYGATRGGSDALMSTMHRPALGRRRRAFTALAAGCAAGDVPLSTVLPPAQCWHCNVTRGVGAQVLGFPGDRFAGVVPGSVEAAPGSVSGHPANPGSGRGRSGNPGADSVHPELPGSVPVRSGPFFALRWTRAEPAFRRWTDSEPCPLRMDTGRTWDRFVVRSSRVSGFALQPFGDFGFGVRPSSKSGFGPRPFRKPGCGFRPSRASGFGSCPFGAVFRPQMDESRTRFSPMAGFRTRDCRGAFGWAKTEPGIPMAPPDGREPNPGSHGHPRMDENRTRDRRGVPEERKPHPGSRPRPRKITARIRDRKRHPNSADSEPGSSGDISVGRPDTKPIACHIRRRCAFLPKCTDCPRYIDARCGVSLMLARAGRPPSPRSPTRLARFPINP